MGVGELRRRHRTRYPPNDLGLTCGPIRPAEPAGRIKSECLDKLVLLGENHLRTAVREYVAHYHTERNHQGLEGRLIELPASASSAGPIVCWERLGALLRFYDREAA